jgi:hypothetical protein
MSAVVQALPTRQGRGRRVTGLAAAVEEFKLVALRTYQRHRPLAARERGITGIGLIHRHRGFWRDGRLSAQRWGCL